MEGHYYKHQQLEPCREGLGTRLTKDLIGRPLLQTPTTGAMQGRPGDEANQRPHWKATTTNTNNWSHAGKAWGRGQPKASLEGYYYKHQQLEPCREGLGTRLTKGLIGRPLLQTPTTGAMQGRPGDEANQRPHWKATTTNTNNWSHAGRPGDEANQRPHWKATTTNTNNWSHAGKTWGRG